MTLASRVVIEMEPSLAKHFKSSETHADFEDLYGVSCKGKRVIATERIEDVTEWEDGYIVFHQGYIELLLGLLKPPDRDLDCILLITSCGFPVKKARADYSQEYEFEKIMNALFVFPKPGREGNPLDYVKIMTRPHYPYFDWSILCFESKKDWRNIVSTPIPAKSIREMSFWELLGAEFPHRKRLDWERIARQADSLLEVNMDIGFLVLGRNERWNPWPPEVQAMIDKQETD